MKVISAFLFMQIILLTSNSLCAQVGIGNASPNPSSALDITVYKRRVINP